MHSRISCLSCGVDAYADAVADLSYSTGSTVVS
jgi:hypothetical protein